MGFLTGLRVLDLSRFVAGPYATMVLGDLGADVMKIESLNGDPTRISKPPIEVGRGSAEFEIVNRNKRSLCVDMRSENGRQILHKLAGTVDVVVDNFRPGVLGALGLTFEELSGVNSSIVSCSITGFGQDGPDANQPSYDLIAQALGGGMSLTGNPETGPSRIGFHIADLSGGAYGAMAILAALVGRGMNGAGARLDISLLDVQASLLFEDLTNVSLTGEVPGLWGTGASNLVPYQAFETADQPIVVAAVGDEKFWRRLCDAVGLQAMAQDPRFSSNTSRVEHRDELIAVLAQRFDAHPRDWWLRTLAEADVPAAPLSDITGVLDNRQLQHREMLVEIPGVPAAIMAGNPLAVGHPRIYARAPRLGEHTREILHGELGYSLAAIEDMHRKGLVHSNPMEDTLG